MEWDIHPFPSKGVLNNENQLSKTGFNEWY